MAISQDLILQIRQKANIVDIISEYISLEQRGKNYFAVCPFHDDHNPSMSISIEKQIYTCFVCGAHGNVFTFIMEYEQVPFIEAVRIIGNKVGIKVDVIEYKEKNIDDKDKHFYDIYDVSNKFYQNNLSTKEGIEAKEYLEKRGFNDEIVKEFGIGLSTNNKLYSLLNKKDYSDNDLLNVGICSTTDGRVYDTFTNRIMFPLWDLDGKIVGFSGRIYNTSDPSKYVNTKESVIFKKGKLLYNYHKAKEDIRRKRSVIIVEGFMDVIALFKIGIKNVVATMGTAVTHDQVLLIKKLSSNVILCFDGDSAGNKATLSCSNELLSVGIVPKVVRLSDNLDPDEYINKYGADKLIDMLNSPKTLLNYKIDYYKSTTNFENSDEVSSYVKNIINELKSEKDNIVRELTIRSLSEETNVSIITLNNMLKNEDVVIQKEKVKEKDNKIMNKYEKAERRLLFYMLRHTEVLKIFERNKCFIPTQELRFLSNEVLYFYKKYGNISIADFISYLDGKEELVNALSLVNTMDISENYSHEEIMDYINLLNSYSIENEIRRLTNVFKSETDEKRKTEIVRQISDLKVSV